MEDLWNGHGKRGGPGLASGWALAAGLVLLSALSGRGQAPDWEKVALPDGTIHPDPAWAEPNQFRQPQPARLAADRAGRIYFSNGTKLHIGHGTSWTTHSKPGIHWDPGRRRALAAGSQGQVIWGEWCSQDGGATWDSLAIGGVASAHAVLGDRTVLLGMGYDAIESSQGCSDAWTRVHMGRTYGNIERFAVAEDALFALPSYAPLLVDMVRSGKGWKEWVYRDHRLTGETVRAMRFQNTSLGTPLFLAVNKPDGKPNTILRLHVFYTGLDTLKGTLPDSAITSLWFDAEGGLWVGTRGQGVHVSRDKGLTFAAVNAGLGGLYVEALESASEGSLYAATREGLYRSRARTGVTGLRSGQPALPDLKPSSRSRARLHLTGLPASLRGDRPKARRSVLADGRLLIAPAGDHDLGHPIR